MLCNCILKRSKISIDLIVGPVGKPTQLESLDSELFQLTYSHFSAFGDLQYLGVSAGESGVIICCIVLYIIHY